MLVVDCANLLLLHRSVEITALPSPTRSKPQHEVQPGASDAPDDRANAGPPGIVPGGRPLSGDWQQGMGQAWSQIASRIDCISGGSAKGYADPQYEDADEQRLGAAA